MRLDGDDWRRFFDAYERDAWRLETLPAYGVASESEEFARFLETGRLDIPPHDTWLTRVRAFRDTGRTIGRVHVLTQPLTDYLRYEMAVYAFTSQAGEDIRILDLTHQENPGLPRQDFWLFDDSKVVLMHYDAVGTQTSRKLYEGDPAPYVAARKLAVSASVPFEEYVRA
ncbi:DUF6879 family protein [Streptomyces boncukensis]|uniref:DUF6879 domain-containing protein n=1 Tax=Streptomyces boncukensis TaxID=2711219 RepID=A0A6G4WW23_9ACTN|nr:DUF6879 family protein [Streptomyces boncukensis]NGO69052.1 hypothetical protein [Streptomyces boncukensis]